MNNSNPSDFIAAAVCFLWLTDDDASAATRTRRNTMLERMKVLSFDAAVESITKEIVAGQEAGEGSHLVYELFCRNQSRNSK